MPLCKSEERLSRAVKHADNFQPVAQKSAGKIKSQRADTAITGCAEQIMVKEKPEEFGYFDECEVDYLAEMLVKTTLNKVICELEQELDSPNDEKLSNLDQDTSKVKLQIASDQKSQKKMELNTEDTHKQATVRKVCFFVDEILDKMLQEECKTLEITIRSAACEIDANTTTDENMGVVFLDTLGKEDSKCEEKLESFETCGSSEPVFLEGKKTERVDTLDKEVSACNEKFESFETCVSSEPLGKTDIIELGEFDKTSTSPSKSTVDWSTLFQQSEPFAKSDITELCDYKKCSSPSEPIVDLSIMFSQSKTISSQNQEFVDRFQKDSHNREVASDIVEQSSSKSKVKDESFTQVGAQFNEMVITESRVSGTVSSCDAVGPVKKNVPKKMTNKLVEMVTVQPNRSTRSDIGNRNEPRRFRRMVQNGRKMLRRGAEFVRRAANEMINHMLCANNIEQENDSDMPRNEGSSRIDVAGGDSCPGGLSHSVNDTTNTLEDIWSLGMGDTSSGYVACIDKVVSHYDLPPSNRQVQEVAKKHKRCFLSLFIGRPRYHKYVVL